MNLLFGPDVSNWDMPAFSPSTMTCFNAAGVNMLAIRDSLESLQLMSVSEAMFGTAQAAGIPWMPYTWAYGTQAPEATANQAITLADPYNPVKRLWFDVEDLTNFVLLNEGRMATPYTPKGVTLTLNYDPATGRSIEFPTVCLPRHALTPHMLKRAGLDPGSAVQWLQRAFKETYALGYKPGVYSSYYYWGVLCGYSMALEGEDGWAANWDNNPNSLAATPFGGLNIIGKQYLGSGQNVSLCDAVRDFDVWDPSVILAPPAPPDPTPAPPPADPCAALKAQIAAMLQDEADARDRLQTIATSITQVLQDIDHTGGSQ